MHRISSHGIFARETRAVPENGQCVGSDGAALGKEKLAAPYSRNNFRLNTRTLVDSRHASVGHSYDCARDRVYRSL
jgi:hypothetical protein